MTNHIICHVSVTSLNKAVTERQTPLWKSLRTLYVQLLVTVPVALLLVFVDLTSSTALAQNTAIKIGSGTLDSNRVDGPKSTRVSLTPSVNGIHTVRVNWNSNADIRFSVFRLVDAPKPNDRVKIGVASGSGRTAHWTGPLDTSEQFFLNIWSADGIADYTATVALTPTDLEILTRPADLTVTEGDDAVFSVTARGSGTLAYRWFADGVEIPGADTDTLLIPSVSLSDSGTRYRVAINDGSDSTGFASALLTVEAGQPALEILTQPADLIVTEGDDAVFSVTARGSGTLAYRWFANGAEIPGADTNTLTIATTDPDDAGTVYTAEISDQAGSSVISNGATLQVTPVNVAVIGQGTLDSTKASDPRWVRVDFNSLATARHTIIVSWNSDADVRFNVFEANGASISPTIKDTNPGIWRGELEAGNSYYIGLWSTNGIADYLVSIEAVVDLSISTQPADLTIQEGVDALFSVTASGSGTLAYQWFADGREIPGADTETLTVAAVSLNDSGTVYSVEISDATGASVVSDTATLNVTEGSGIFQIPAEEFDWHTYPGDMAGYSQDAELVNVRQLAVGAHLNIRYWIESTLNSYFTNLVNAGTAFEVCATVANLNRGQTNSVRMIHPDPNFNQLHVIDSDQYETICSKPGQSSGERRTAGVKVVSSSEGPVEVRNIIIRPFQFEFEASAQLTTATFPAWELDLFRSPVSTRPDGRNLYEVNEQAWAVLTLDDVVYMGGEFQNTRKGQNHASPAQRYIAAFDRRTGQPVAGFNIELDGPVHTLAVSPDNNTLYVGGIFRTANGQSRRNFAAFNIAGNTTSLNGFRLKNGGMNISPNNLVKTIAVTDEELYIGGTFTKFGGLDDYAYLAAFDRDSGEIVQSFRPKPDDRVNSLVAGGSEGLWIGGEFEKLNGTDAMGLALVDPMTGELDTSSPTVPYPIIDLAATPTQLFVAGGGQNRTSRFTGNIAGAFNRITLEMQWELQGDGNVQAVDVDDGRFVYFAGHYQRFRYIRDSAADPNGKWIRDGDQIERLSRHDKRTGEIDFTWLPFVNGIRSINGIDVTTDDLSIVGDFLRVGGDTTNSNDPRKKNHRGFATFKGRTD